VHPMDSKTTEMEKPMEIAIVVAEKPAVPQQNDSAEGLARMYQDLDPLAKALRSACSILFIFSVLLFGSLEGILGLCAACGVLCCAAPGSLGTAYAARCTRVLAILCAGAALCQIMVLSTVGVLVPDVAPALDDLCSEVHAEAADQTTVGELPGVPLRQHAAQNLVAFVASGARRLQAVAPASLSDMKCERASAFVQNVLPTAVAVGLTFEFGLFIAALITAKASRRIMFEARRQGANAM